MQRAAGCSSRERVRLHKPTKENMMSAPAGAAAAAQQELLNTVRAVPGYRRQLPPGHVDQRAGEAGPMLRSQDAIQPLLRTLDRHMERATAQAARSAQLERVQRTCCSTLPALVLLSAVWITGVIQHCRGTASPAQARTLIGVGLGLSGIVLAGATYRVRNSIQALWRG
jgi:hypothetical protein